MLRFPIKKQFRFHKLKVTDNFGTHSDPFTKSFARIHNGWLSIRVSLILGRGECAFEIHAIYTVGKHKLIQTG